MSESGVTPRRCLVIDDEAGMRDMLAFGLVEFCYTVETAANGSEALRLVRKEKFDLVICDVVLPGQNGLQILREMKIIDPSLKVVMITGSPQDAMAVACIREGALGYLSKPFTIQELTAVLDAQSQAPAAHAAPMAAALDVLARPIRRILVVDDDPSVSNLFRCAFERDGYEVESACDGQQALVKMTQAPPDLLLLDLMMPAPDGFYLLNAMQHVPALRGIRIIVVTAIRLTEQQRKFLDGKTIAVVQKGDQTLEQIRECLQQKGKKAS